MVPEQSGIDAKEKVRQFVAGMTPEERMLITLRDELYGGRWDEMQTDLEERLAGGQLALDDHGAGRLDALDADITARINPPDQVVHQLA